MNYNQFINLLYKSKRYELTEDGILIIKDYYTGEEVKLDLKKMTEETFNEIKEED